jgi:hypothetical protein
MTITPQAQRIRQELRAAGVTSFGLAKFASKYLPTILHPDEHVKGAVYGRYTEGRGSLAWTEGMLIATDRRILFVDHKPGFSTLDELTYDIVSGVKKVFAWPFSSVTLHTKLGDYMLRFANAKCIDILVHYIEQRRLETESNTWPGMVHEQRIARIL